MPAIPGDTITEKLGQGGMGIVYKAEQIAVKRNVALKMIRHASGDLLVRLRREAELLARVQHPSIVQIYEVGACAGGEDRARCGRCAPGRGRAP
jgi:serine/threonine protein kinase